MEETSVNLIDCIGSLTGKTIAMNGDVYVYLDTKEAVEQSVLDEAVALKNKTGNAMTTKRQIDDAKAYLLDTDWYTARYIDSGTIIPTDVIAKRIEMRALINSLEEKLA